MFVSIFLDINLSLFDTQVTILTCLKVCQGDQGSQRPIQWMTRRNCPLSVTDRRQELTEKSEAGTTHYYSVFYSLYKTLISSMSHSRGIAGVIIYIIKFGCFETIHEIYDYSWCFESAVRYLLYKVQILPQRMA